MKKKKLSQSKDAIRKRKKIAALIVAEKVSLPPQDQSGPVNHSAGPVPGPVKPPKVTPYPRAGRKVQEFEDRLDRQLAGETSAPKRGRGRPIKEGQPEPPEIDVNIIGQAVQIPFDLWSISQELPELKISIQESVMIAKPLKQLLDHYVPQVPEIAWAWISLGAVSYSIMKSRLELIAAIKKAKASQSPESRKNNPMDDVRGSNPPVGHGSPNSSGRFPTFEEMQNPRT